MSHVFNWCLDKTRITTWDKQLFSVNKFGNKYWYMNGKRHRENGPAVEWANGSKFWYLNDVCYLESDYWKELKK